ncbi:predicted protein [Nematostella vectensis]|uniref:Nucleotidyl transferase domain-containing protein n=1 Tax=Nematostella vectensis TaxID=45351 RepID=A7RY84_NEMVE|nr:predicted protein [Nematostella vectensis]|eukprot:XP_001635655.1 predicted protein [Nematostella vectensis]
MKAVILAAGYGTRLERDIREDSSQKFAHLLGVPKPLLPIRGESLVSQWMGALAGMREIDQVFLVTNKLFLEKFKSWACDWPVEILCDGSTCNEDRLGAVAAIQLCIEHMTKNSSSPDDLLVIGGDTLFYDDFSVDKFVQSFYEKQQRTPSGGHVLCYKCSDTETSKFGILETNEDGMITAFLEKPGPEATTSRWACPCCYIISRENLKLVKNFLDEKRDSPIKCRDAPGNLIQCLFYRVPLYTMEISGRFDVGGLESYKKCDFYFKR